MLLTPRGCSRAFEPVDPIEHMRHQLAVELVDDVRASTNRSRSHTGGSARRSGRRGQAH